MSVVTNIILTSRFGAEHALRAFFEDWFKDRKHPVLERVDKEVPSGEKHMERAVYLGAFNYFPEEEFMDAFHDWDWPYPELLSDMQLFVCGQHDARFAVYNWNDDERRFDYQPPPKDGSEKWSTT